MPPRFAVLSTSPAPALGRGTVTRKEKARDKAAGPDPTGAPPQPGGQLPARTRPQNKLWSLRETEGPRGHVVGPGVPGQELCCPCVSPAAQREAHCLVPQTPEGGDPSPSNPQPPFPSTRAEVHTGVRTRTERPRGRRH